jgi:hypothetical protein
MQGMDTALRYAQQAENEANAPRLFVPFYSFVEKAREGASMEEQQLAFAYGVGLMLDYLSVATLSLATTPAKVVGSVAARETVAAGEAAVEAAAGTVKTAVRRGGAFRRFFYDARDFKQAISREYWETRRPANGRSLHHWLFPQRATWIPEGIRNAGFNLLELPAYRGVFHRSLALNQWMGLAPNWRGLRSAAAIATENGIRVTLPVAGGMVMYGGYKAGNFTIESLSRKKR